jgi:hypothetical protein
MLLQKIELNDNYIKFSHQGDQFDLDTLSNLIKQQSTKHNDEDKVGQYGTGFMTTHVFSRKVYISGDCKIDYDENKSMYVSLPKDFCLDRSSDDKEIFIKEMDKELKIVDNLISNEGKEEPDRWTDFKYQLSNDKIEKINQQLNITTILMPFVLVFNDKIKECSITNETSYNLGNKITVYRKSGDRVYQSLPYNSHYRKATTKILIEKDGNSQYVDIISLETGDGSDRVIIPPLPACLDKVENIPSQFLFFPMLGTENFGTNFIFHSSRLYPTEPRNSYLLPQDNDGSRVKYLRNEEVLDEMFDMLFSYYKNNLSSQNLPLNFAKVEFTYNGDDDITKAYFAKLQKKFSDEFVTWKIIPTNNGYLPIKNDNSFVVLDQSIYSCLNEEQLKKYIPVVSVLAKEFVTIPDSNIVEWSKIVHSWAPDEESYYIKLDKICQHIKSKSSELKTFLLLLNDLGKTGIDLMSNYAIIPNRKGELRKSVDLRNGKTITSDLYDISKYIIGDKAGKLVDSDFACVTMLTEYTRTDLKNEIKSSIEELRKSTIEYKEYGNNKPRLLEELQDSITIEQLANYCSAYTTPSPSSNRARLMPIICGLYNIEYKTIVIPQVSQDEPDLFTSAFNFLVDNTMYMISMKPASWLTDEDNHESNLNLLINFVSVFTETKDEQHLKKLDDYGIIPNQLNEVNKVRDLKKNVSIDDDLQQIYKNIFQKDLKTSFVKKDFESFYDFKEYEPKDVGDEIEKELKQRNYEGTDIIYIIDKLNNGKWVDYFPNIEDKKEDIYYKHGTKEDKEAIYHIQMLGSEKIKLIADLSKSKDFEAIINKAKDLRFQQQERERQFQFTYTIGKHIENIIRNEVNKELSCDEKLLADDIQDGQDMVISYKGHDLYYLECKAKWNFSEPAHMSSLQIKQAVRKIGHYALCCIDCTDSGCKVSANASENDVEEAQDDIIANTYVNNNIGYAFKSIVSSLIQQEDDSTIKEDDTIKVHGDLSCNISKKVFKNGMPFAKFIEQLKSDLERACNEINQQSVKYQ